jgi:hypothetical protein
MLFVGCSLLGFIGIFARVPFFGPCRASTLVNVRKKPIFGFFLTTVNVAHGQAWQKPASTVSLFEEFAVLLLFFSHTRHVPFDSSSSPVPPQEQGQSLAPFDAPPSSISRECLPLCQSLTFGYFNLSTFHLPSSRFFNFPVTPPLLSLQPPLHSY